MTAGSTGASALVRAARDAGVDVCFANPGTSEMHFVSALDDSPGIRPVLGLHETVCTGAADGYGRMAGKPAMTLLHLGPGLANGLANLHNARRARTPLINVVGDMAGWHTGADALLAMDIDALAGTVSAEVHRVKSHTQAPALFSRAHSVRGVTTLIVPHDVAWARQLGSAAHVGRTIGEHQQNTTEVAENGMREFARDLASAMKSCRPGKLGIYCGGKALLDEGDVLLKLGQVAAATSGILLCENAFSRIDRGHGRPHMQRLPYFPQDALAALQAFDVLVLVDARPPVANFGYEGGPSQLVTQQEPCVWEVDGADVDVGAVLSLLVGELGASGIVPFKNCRGTFASPKRPPLPQGKLTAATLCTTVAALQPEDAVIVDEALTSATAYWEASRGCPPFSHLTLTGGAIGAGIPMALGAALACPGRKVINLQADGSGLYSAQALWSEARENAAVLTIICSNRSYAILRLELAKQRITPSNGPAARALTDLSNPPIDWVALAQGYGVRAARVTTCEELAEQVKEGLQYDGPMLIEAII